MCMTKKDIDILYNVCILYNLCLCLCVLVCPYGTERKSDLSGLAEFQFSYSPKKASLSLSLSLLSPPLFLFLPI